MFNHIRNLTKGISSGAVKETVVCSAVGVIVTHAVTGIVHLVKPKKKDPWYKRIFK